MEVLGGGLKGEILKLSHNVQQYLTIWWYNIIYDDTQRYITTNFPIDKLFWFATICLILLKNVEINRLPAQGNDLNRLIVQRYTTKYDYKRQYETVLDWEGGFRLCCDLLIWGEGWLKCPLKYFKCRVDFLFFATAHEKSISLFRLI